MATTEAPQAALELYQETEPQAPADLVSRATAVAVTDQPSAEAASALRNEIAEARKSIEDAIAPHVKRAHETWKGLTEERKRQTAPLLELEQTVGAKITAWQTEMARLERERLRAEAAEAERRAAEERRKREEALRAEGLRRDDAREIARSEVQAELAEKRIAAANVSAPSVGGSSLRQPWVGVVVDIRALCREIGAGRAPANLIEIAQGALNRYAQATNGEAQIEGVEFKRAAKSVRTGR